MCKKKGKIMVFYHTQGGGGVWGLNGENQKAKSSESTWASCSIAPVCFLQIWALISSVLWLLDDLPCSHPGCMAASRRAFAPCHPFANLAVNWKCEALHWWDIEHSFIIIREVLILTLSIFTALYGCISWYSLEAEMAYWVKWSSKITLSNTLPAP